MKKAKKDIEDYIIAPWQPEIRAKLKANHVSLPNGFLMYGPSGTGKTFIVSTIAKQTGYPLYIITGSTVGSKWMGETPQKLKNIFAELENRYRADKDHKPSILFFDELDDIGGTREGNTSPGKREDVNALLLQLNNAAERGIIAIGATNCIDIVDTALTRSGRFDKKIEVTLPDRDERKDILTKLISKKAICMPLFKHIDLIADKTDGKSPADLAKYIDTCARLAICKQRPVTLESFEELVEEIDLANPRRRIGFSTIR